MICLVYTLAWVVVDQGWDSGRPTPSPRPFSPHPTASVTLSFSLHALDGWSFVSLFLQPPSLAQAVI